jgi:2-polyprenyl-3-methyl-5-hydroxy-6-metoxy-1,4-benzoquinol methylase
MSATRSRVAFAENQADLLLRLKCPVCGGALARESEATISCFGCLARYAVRGGIPLLVAPAAGAEDDTPSQPSAQPVPQASIKSVLSRFHLDSVVRRLWHAYLHVDRFLTPNGPTDPTFWMDRVLRLLPKPASVVLDFGGGSGWFSDYVPDSTYIVLEPDLTSSSVQQNENRHQYVIGDGHDDLFAEATFDAIAMFEVLEHVRNPFRVIRNIARWLKPGGVLVLSTPQYWHVHGWPSDYFRYTNYGLRELARTAGMEIVDLWPMGGPCLLIWSAVRLNFSFLNWPLLRQLIVHPSFLLARFCDWVFFRHNLERGYPDTRGWMMVARRKA